jgi:hypothetical protein
MLQVFVNKILLRTVFPGIYFRMNISVTYVEGLCPMIDNI